MDINIDGIIHWLINKRASFNLFYFYFLSIYSYINFERIEAIYMILKGILTILATLRPKDCSDRPSLSL